MEPDATRDLETRIRSFAAEHHRVPTPAEVRLLVNELGISRDSLTDLAERVAPAPGGAAPSDPSPRLLTGTRSGPSAPALFTSGSIPLPPVAAPEAPGWLDAERPAHSLSASTDPVLDSPSTNPAPPVVTVGPVATTTVGPRPRTSDAAVRRAVDDLTDDWHRQGGRLGADDVTRLVAKRDLSATQQVAVVETLADLGIEPETREDMRQAHHGAERERADEEEAEESLWPQQLNQTALSTDQLKDYLRAIAKTPLLFAEEEVRLGRTIEAGLKAETELGESATQYRETERTRLETIVGDGRAAQRELVRANLRLVVSIAKNRAYDGQGLDLADRIQEGNLGLMRAAVKFDHSLGYKFSTYATWWIRQAVGRGLADRGRLVRLPVHVVENLRKIRGAQRGLTSRYGRTPTAAELAEATGLAETTVRAILDYGLHVVSLDAPAAGADGDLTLGDLLRDEADVDGRNDPVECVLASARRRDLDDLLGSSLSPREQDIIERRNGYDGGIQATLEELGRDYNLTRERIRQLESKAYSRVRATNGVVALYEYLSDDLADEPPVPASARRPRAASQVETWDVSDVATSPLSPEPPAPPDVVVVTQEAPETPTSGAATPAAEVSPSQDTTSAGRTCPPQGVSTPSPDRSEP